MGCIDRLVGWRRDGEIVSVASFNSLAILVSELTKALMDCNCDSIKVKDWMAGWNSLVIEERDWCESSNLLPATARKFADSAISKVFLDCSEVVALIKLCSWSVSLVSDLVIDENLPNIAMCKLLVMCSISLCNIRNLIALIVEEMLSGILFSRDVVKRMLARDSVVKLPLTVIKAHCSR